MRKLIKCFDLFPAISAEFILEMCVAARNRENFIKTPYFRGSRSFKVINADITKKLVACAFLSYAVCLYLSATIFALEEPIAIKQRYLRKGGALLSPPIS